MLSVALYPLRILYEQKRVEQNNALNYMLYTIKSVIVEERLNK